MFPDLVWMSATMACILAIGTVTFMGLKLLIAWKSGRAIASGLSIMDEAIFITGCDTGIGYQCAKLYDRLGFRVFAGCLSPHGDSAKKLLSETSRVQIVHLDITDEQKVAVAYETIAAAVHDRGLWGLVNNAGVLCYGEFQWCTWNQCQRQIDVNLTGTIRIVRTFLPLIRRRRGRIMTITSVNGLLAYPAQSVYCATKFGLEGFCDSLRLELKRCGVSVVTVQLGDFARLTDIFAGHMRDAEEMWASMSRDQQMEENDYFWNFHRLAEAKRGLTSPRSFKASQLFSDLRDAMVAANPQGHYLCMPPIQRLVIQILLLLPSSLKDILLTYMFGKAFRNV